MSVAIVLAGARNDSQAGCPKCDKLVHCHSEIMQMAFHPRYVQFVHDDCGTRWRRYIDEERTEIVEDTQ
jgi:hypothetical protein